MPAEVRYSLQLDFEPPGGACVEDFGKLFRMFEQIQKLGQSQIFFKEERFEASSREARLQSFRICRIRAVAVR